jgi:uncharacterized damage-inducible protein DinB
MPLRDTFLNEFDHETAGTRKVLERVPDGKFDWRPHPKSGTMGWLASHLANIPTWVGEAVHKDSIDIAPGGVPMPPPPQAATRAALLEAFDRNVAAARAALVGASDECLTGPWSLLMNGKQIFTMPRATMVRLWVLNHSVHHRAQLGVYLRLNDIPVPAIYGPSADESGM